MDTDETGQGLLLDVSRKRQRCRVCGRKLKSKKARRDGMGRTCRKRIEAERSRVPE